MFSEILFLPDHNESPTLIKKVRGFVLLWMFRVLIFPFPIIVNERKSNDREDQSGFFPLPTAARPTDLGNPINNTKLSC